MKLTFPVLLAGAAIALGLGLVAYKNQGPKTEDNTPPIASANVIEVRDQRAGSIVTISSATLEKPGFISIHKANGNRLGEIVATSPLLAAGENTSFFVSANLSKGEYFAVLHTDNGDAKFSERGDVVAENNGEQVKVKFSAL